MYRNGENFKNSYNTSRNVYELLRWVLRVLLYKWRPCVSMRASYWFSRQQCSSMICKYNICLALCPYTLHLLNRFLERYCLHISVSLNQILTSNSSKLLNICGETREKDCIYMDKPKVASISTIRFKERSFHLCLFFKRWFGYFNMFMKVQKSLACICCQKM